MISNRFATFFWGGSAVVAAGLVALVPACSSENAGLPEAGAPAAGGSDSGGGGSDSGGGAPAASPTVAACASDAGASAVLSFENQTYKGDPRARPTEALFTGLNTLDDPYTQVMRLTNAGASPVTITTLGVAGQSAASLFPVDYRQHSLPAAFKATIGADGGSLPVTIAAGASLDVTVQFLSTKANPPSRFDNIGDDAVAAWLVAQTSSDCVQAGLYGISYWNNPESISDASGPSVNYARYEPTLGQILATLGYQVNVGENLKTYLNVNAVTPTVLAVPPIGDSPSAEVFPISGFTKADPAQPVVLLAVGRFSPKVDYPFGWFAAGSVSPATSQPAALTPLVPPAATDLPQGLQVVATMVSTPQVNNGDPDSYNSDHSEMVLPPITGTTAGTFDPGPGTFGLWCFSAQRSDATIAYDGGITPNVDNGDYNYTEDDLNIIGGSDAGVNGGLASPVHRYSVWPLKNRAGAAIANSYFIGIEEAANGDYNDMVFTLSNVTPVLGPDAGGPPPATVDAGGGGAPTDAKADAADAGAEQ